MPLEEFQVIMTDTIFAPCPGGNTNMTFRLIESLESGAIPIVDEGLHSPPYVLK